MSTGWVYVKPYRWWHRFTRPAGAFTKGCGNVTAAPPKDISSGPIHLIPDEYVVLPFERQFGLPPEPEGDDEIQVILLYLRERGPKGAAWKDLPEFARESWRREYRLRP